MSLSGKLVSQVDIKSDGDVFHEIFRERPHHISDMSPDHIQNCDLHEGQWGTVGSIIYWNYTHGNYLYYFYFDLIELDNFDFCSNFLMEFKNAF